MILAVGLDAVGISRFSEWHLKPHKQLLRIFTEQEIDYCLSVPIKSAERFAARFAAKEALYKALSQLDRKHAVPFLTLCKESEVVLERAPALNIAWQKLGLVPHKTLLTITHTQMTAIAVVIIHKIVEN